jgi:hypothetical protein
MMNITRGIYIQGCARSGNTLIRELCGVAFRDMEMVKLTKDTAECSLAHLAGLLDQSPGGAKVRVASRNYENSLAMDRELLRGHPDIKVLWMLRDPRDILTSIHDNQPDKYYVTPERLIKSLELYGQFKDEPQVLTVRYEDLVTHPEVQQAKISERCGLTPSREFVEAYKYFPKFHENVRAMHSIRPIDTHSLQKWRNNPGYRDYLKRLLAMHGEIITLARECGYEIAGEL